MAAPDPGRVRWGEVEGGPGQDAVRCGGITVRFGSLAAVSDASFSLRWGGIHALVGQNGAGKTTLARVMAGLQPPDRGTVEIGGAEIPPGDHRAARAAGVDMVHQHASLVPALTVAEALELWSPRGPIGGYRRRAIEERWRRYLQSREVTVDVRRRVSDLPVETVQSIEIARSDPGPGGLLILDEPTAVLAPNRVSRLFEQLRATVASGVTVIIVLHKLAEVREIADSVTVMRGGRIVLDPTPIGEVDDASLAELIVGVEQRAEPQPAGPARVAPNGAASTGAGTRGNFSRDDLRAEDLRATGGSGASPLRGVSLSVGPGEIVGVAGVEGNGQRTLVEVLAGLRPADAGTVTILGVDVTEASTRERRRAGLRLVPFDRNTQGVSGDLSLWENVTSWEAERYRRHRRLPFIGVQAMRREARRRLARFNVAYSDIEQRAGSLSGGNMQRLILARELPEASALIAAHPTRGLDIGGMRAAWESLHDLVARRVPVLVVSSDLEELLTHCDRILVLRGGQIEGEFAPPFERSEIGRAMTGAAATAA